MTTEQKKEQKINKVGEEVLGAINRGLDRGELIWTKTWNGASGILPINHKYKTNYNGLNCYLTWIALEEGYEHNEWVTINQIIDLKGLKKGKGKYGGLVDKKGNKVKGVKLLKERKDGKKQKRCPVEHWSIIFRRKEDWKYFKGAEYKEAIEKGIHEPSDFYRYWAITGIYYVYNIEQTTLPLPKVRKKKVYKTTNAEKIVNEVYLNYENAPTMKVVNTDKACYKPLSDVVQIPLAEQFKSKYESVGGNHFAHTCFHEFIHSTGHEKRLSRDGITIIDLFNEHKENYAYEELIAEMGGCMMMAYHGLDTSETIDNSQAYVKGWLTALKNDRELIPQAIKESARAVRHILSI